MLCFLFADALSLFCCLQLVLFYSSLRLFFLLRRLCEYERLGTRKHYHQILLHCTVTLITSKSKYHGKCQEKSLVLVGQHTTQFCSSEITLGVINWYIIEQVLSLSFLRQPLPGSGDSSDVSRCSAGTMESLRFLRPVFSSSVSRDAAVIY